MTARNGVMFLLVLLLLHLNKVSQSVHSLNCIVELVLPGLSMEVKSIYLLFEHEVIKLKCHQYRYFGNYSSELIKCLKGKEEHLMPTVLKMNLK